MKNLKLYQTPEMVVLPVDPVDLITASDNDKPWNEKWTDYIFR